MKVIGLMSGTSMDGITAALTEILEKDGKLDIKLLSYETFPYPEELREELMEVAEDGHLNDLCRLNFEIGEKFAEAAENLLNEEEVELIGSHGQTVCHLPPDGNGGKTYTLQIGEADVIAERTGIKTVADFRTRDVAAGGEGAPLIPFVDYKLFQSNSKNRVALNIGGIANITYLPTGGGKGEVIAFDTGPGNMVLDQLVRDLTDGRMNYDENGAMARRGEVSEQLLSKLMDNPYFDRSPPKSTGRKDFGKAFTNSVKERGRQMGMDTNDIIASVTAFTAESIKYSCDKYLRAVDELIAAGGGTENDTLMEELQNRVNFPVKTTDEFGIPPEAKEAVGFAILAYETNKGRPSNILGATGAKKYVVLGKISSGEVAENER